MKIRSRATPETFGEGDYTFNLSFEEVQLIAAFLYVTRLGEGVYKPAALSLLNMFEDAFDEDFNMEASEDVGLSVSVVNEHGTIIDTFDDDHFILEVV
jgi:hypothetical protein